MPNNEQNRHFDRMDAVERILHAFKDTHHVSRGRGCHATDLLIEKGLIKVLANEFRAQRRMLSQRKGRLGRRGRPFAT